ncbi:MAG: 2-oxo acid dehydrogenase subunit E2 [Chloroflexia bacterium]|nr:2-oxo acid dehydrogenase subunit E2 [Chloroflexia bacterium]
MPTDTALTVTMPQLGESVTEGTVGAWLKRIGDQVDKYDPLVEVVTDKVNAEVPSPVSGVLVEILVEPMTTVPVGASLCRIAEEGAVADVSSPPLSTNGLESEAPPAATGRKENAKPVLDELERLRTRSSPVVRRIAEEHGIQLGQVSGSGVGGRVTKQDILSYVTETPRSDPEPALVTTPSGPERRDEGMSAGRAGSLRPGEEPSRASQVTLYPGDEVIALSPMRRMIADHMVRSERTAPHVTVVMEVDMSRVVALRTARREEFRRREGIDLTYLPFALKAVSLALREHPRLNAVWDEERIIHRAAINLGVAVSLDDGLIVPVIHHADRLSITGLMHAVTGLAAKARSGALTPDDVAGGTFTVNNPGTFGSLVSTPILVQPQVGILSTEAIVKRAVVIDEMIGVRSMMNLSLSVDHRVLDGLAAARFLRHVKNWLEAVDENLPLV